MVAVPRYEKVNERLIGYIEDVVDIVNEQNRVTGEAAMHIKPDWTSIAAAPMLPITEDTPILSTKH